MKQSIVKVILILSIFLITSVSLISFNFDKLPVVENIYNLARIMNFLNIFMLGLFIYLIYFSIKSGFLYRKIFLFLVNQKEAEDLVCKRLQYALLSVFLISFLFLVFSICGITVFSGHKCRNNDIANCTIDQNTLKTVYLFNPGVYLLRNKETASFRKGDMIYFSALPRRDTEFFQYLLLIILPIVVVRFNKTS